MGGRRGQARLAADIGGTFTDVALETGGRLFTAKVLTTPAAPEEGVIEGIETVLGESGVETVDVSLVIHGTTLATNAIIERKGAVTALITTDGFRDVIEIGYESRYDQYDIMIEKQAPLVPRQRRLTVPERSDVHGRIIIPLDEAAVRNQVPRLESLGIESVAVGFLHAYANPAHERRVREILKEALPDLRVSLSCEVCPEVREYERFTTTTVNAYIQPLMSGYLGRLDSRLRQTGLGCPVLLMTSAGGLTDLETAAKLPVRLVESGPAGGAMLAMRVAAELELENAISFDMGGTTAKICLIEAGRATIAREFEVDRAARFVKGSGLPLRLPVIEMLEIGAGGGSIARVDRLGKIAVGPDSAGAEPGPAAYARGGAAPTVTDADITLGRIAPESFAGGRISLDPGLAAAAIERDLCGQLELTHDLAAYAVSEMVEEAMANAARVHAVEQGKDPAAHDLIAFGGAGPLHAGRLSEKLGIDRFIVPSDAGVGSAIGFLRAPVSYEVVRSRNMRLGAFDAAVANAILAEMEAEGLEVISAAVSQEEPEVRRGAYMRYLGQGHETLVSLPRYPLEAADGARLRDEFEDLYRRLFGRVIEGAEIEVLTWVLSASTASPPLEAARKPPRSAAPPPAALRDVVDAEDAVCVSIPAYRRRELPPGARLEGPALIVEEQTTTLVPRRFAAAISASGHIIVERREETEG